MDRRRPLAALLTLVLAGASASLPIREANWLAPEKRVEALTTEPGLCIGPAIDDATLLLIGDAAFRTPFLLGGQAARAGLNCASCHRNGRGNPHFIFPGISGAPGTADVTASILSSHRGDGKLNPKPIPDLVLDPPKVPLGELRGFIRGLIVEEFDGAEPPPRILDALVLYVSEQRRMECGEASVRTTLEASLMSLKIALDAASSAFEAGDRPTARLMTLAARSELGRIDERFAGPSFADERAKLDRYDQALQGNLRLLDSGKDAESALANASYMVELIRGDLAPLEAQSFYNPKRLKAALKAALKG